LYQEIKPWSQELASQGQCGVDLILALESQETNHGVSSSILQSDVALSHAVLTSTLQLATTSPVNQFIQQVEALPPFA
jgi:hypothetical protein